MRDGVAQHFLRRGVARCSAMQRTTTRYSAVKRLSTAARADTPKQLCRRHHHQRHEIIATTLTITIIITVILLLIIFFLFYISMAIFAAMYTVVVVRLKGMER
jgi:hypothetical protein